MISLLRFVITRMRRARISPAQVIGSIGRSMILRKQLERTMNKCRSFDESAMRSVKLYLGIWYEVELFFMTVID